MRAPNRREILQGVSLANRTAVQRASCSAAQRSLFLAEAFEVAAAGLLGLLLSLGMTPTDAAKACKAAGGIVQHVPTLCSEEKAND